jgi:hypothetical protein
MKEGKQKTKDEERIGKKNVNVKNRLRRIGSD